MNPDQLAYAKSIGMSDVAVSRVDEAIREAEHLSHRNIDRFFVSDVSDENGTRDYQSLWMFSDDFVAEAKNFLARKNLDFVRRPALLEYVEFTYANTDLVTFQPNSRVRVEGRFIGIITFELRATGNNCQNLLDVYNEVFWNWGLPDDIAPGLL